MKSNLPTIRRRAGFTLIEIMIVVGIIALLSAVAFPSLAKARKNAQLGRLLTHLKTNANAFTIYAAENGKVPYEAPNASVTSNANEIPPGMATYLSKKTTWTNGADGTWYWCYIPGQLAGFKCFVFLANTTLTPEDLTYFDKKLDDGNIATGSVQGIPNFGIVVGVE